MNINTTTMLPEQMNLKLDYHAHILPGCDHGCDAVPTALEQLSMAKEADVETICATPHFYPQNETIASFLERRAKAFAALAPYLTEEQPKIELGAEVLICEGMEGMDSLPALCRSGTNELLLEMPFYAWQTSIWDTLYGLFDREDIQVVIAHADRYPAENIERLIEEEIPLQLNAACLVHPLQRRRYLRWIDSGAVRYLGSDIHMRGTAYRDWKKSVRLIQKRG